MRVTDFLSDNHIPFETLLHPPAFTAAKLARFLRVSGRLVVKSVLLVTRTGPVLAVLPAAKRVDLNAMSQVLGGSVRLAREDELLEIFRDCEPGTLTPFGRLYGIPTVLEACVAPDARIVFESQAHVFAVRMDCRDYIRIESPQRIHFCADDVETMPHPRAG